MEYMPRPPQRKPFGFKQNNRNGPTNSEMLNLNALYDNRDYENLFIEYRKLREKYWPEYPNGVDPFPNNFTRERYETAKMQLYTYAIGRIKQYTTAKDIVDFINRHPSLLSFSDIEDVYKRAQQDYEANARKQAPLNEFDGLTPVQIFEKYRANRSVYEKNPKYVEIYNKSKLDMLNEGNSYLAGKTPSQILEFFRQNPSYILINELLPIKQRAEANQNAAPPKPPGDADRARRQAEADARAGERFARQMAEEEARRQAEEEARRARQQAEEDARRARQAPPEPQRGPEPPKAGHEPGLDDLNLNGVPSACTSFMPIYNDYKSKKIKVENMINENKSQRVIQVTFDQTVKILNNIKNISLNGNPRGDRGCNEFPEWYNTNKYWFTSQFNSLKNLLNKYNTGKSSADKLIMTKDEGKDFNFNGGKKKTKKSKKNIKSKSKKLKKKKK